MKQSYRVLSVIVSGVVISGCGGSAPEAPAEETTPAEAPAMGEIVRLDPRFDALVPADAVIEKLTDGYTFTE